MEPKGYFLHRRQLTDEGQAAPRGGVTAYVVSKYNEETKETAILYSLARCSFLDNFARATGRRIAVGRFQAGKAAGILLEPLPRDEAKKRTYEVLVEMCDREVTAARNQFTMVRIWKQNVKDAQKTLREVIRGRRGAIAP